MDEKHSQANWRQYHSKLKYIKLLQAFDNKFSSLRDDLCLHQWTYLVIHEDLNNLIKQYQCKLQQLNSFQQHLKFTLILNELKSYKVLLILDKQNNTFY